MLTHLMKRQQRLLPIWLILLAYGFNFEWSAFYAVEGKAGQVLLVLAGVALLAIYAVPAVWGLFRASRSWSLDWRLILMALLTGLFITGWLASYGNEWLGVFWQAVLPEKVYTDWEAALTAPVVEEFLKTSFAFFCLYFFKAFDKRHVFMVGLATGLGFQIIEDIAYVVSESSLDIEAGILVAISRITGLLASHYLYSALLTLGLYLLFSKAKDLPAWKIYLWAFGPLVLHFIWNSPLNTSGFLSAVMVGLSLWMLADAVTYLMDYQKAKV